MESLLAIVEAENQKSYDGLVVTIEAVQDKMGVIFAICDSPELQLSITYQYEQELLPSIRSYRVEIPQDEPNIRLAVDQVVASEQYLQSGEAAVVTVLGLEKISSFKSAVASDDDSRSSLEKFFGYLQWTRESFRELKFPIVIWVSNELVKKIVRQAPDFWSWRQDVFEFRHVMPSNVSLLIHQFSESSQNSVSTIIPLSDLLQVAASLEQEDFNSPLLSSTYLRLGQAFYQVAANDFTVDHSTEIALSKDYFQLGMKRLKSDDFSELADALSNLAEVYFFQNEFLMSQNLYKQALENYRKVEDRYSEANTLQKIGDSQIRVYEMTTALESYQHAIEIYRQVGARLGEANTLKELGALCAAENNYEQALTYYQQRAEINHQINNVYGEGYTYSYIAETLIKLDQIPAAIEAYQRSINLFNQINMPELSAEIQAELKLIS